MTASSPMDAAFEEAEAAAARGEVPVGAVITRDGAILARAGNRVLTDLDPTAHAEIVAIRAACAVLGSERLVGCDLHVTLEPCPMCAGAISHARLRRVYFGAADEKGGGVLNGPRVFDQSTCHHRPEIYDGLGARRAETLLKDFFRSKR